MKNSEIYYIKDMLADIVLAIKSVIKVDVTIIDEYFNRLVATGQYKKMIGYQVSEESVFSKVLQTGQSYIVENPKEDPVCENCANRNQCTEAAEVCAPIIVNGKVKGVIGLIAFDQQQKACIIKDKNNLLEFISQMARLIESKVVEQKQKYELQKKSQELEIIVDSMDAAMVLIDNDGTILKTNDYFSNFFKKCPKNIKNIIKNIDLTTIKSYKKNIESTYQQNDKNIQIIYNIKPLYVQNKVEEYVVTIKKVTALLEVMNEVFNPRYVTTFDDIIGKSSAIKEVKEFASSVSKSQSTLLITGDSGTGKELFARSIHYNSLRNDKPFVAINCAAIPENLLESELFGYVEGAFTGAQSNGRIGKFEFANGGTIFLDEIADMSIHLQAKLLRVLQEKQITKVGGHFPIDIDVRIIAATNKDLYQLVEDGGFRKDLYYRLNVIPLEIPPLVDREDDVLILAEYFIKKYNQRLNKDIYGVSRGVQDYLMSYHWPGNVRELENLIEYMVNLSKGNLLTLEVLPNRFLEKVDCSRGEKYDVKSLSFLEKQMIEIALKKNGSSKEGVKKSIEALGISRATYYRKLKKHNIVSK